MPRTSAYVTAIFVYPGGYCDFLFPFSKALVMSTVENIKMLSELKCLVTGASSGIGKATCQVLTSYGAKVVGTARSQEALQALQDEGSIAHHIVADVTQEGECDRVVRTAAQLLGVETDPALTTVVIAAGALQGGAVGDADIQNYHYNMKVNAQAPFEIVHAAVPFLKKSPGNPSIVIVSSVNGKQSFAGCASYCMSKAAVDQLVRCASVDLAKDGIRVNAVNPGVIETNLHKVSTTALAVCFYSYFHTV